MARLSVSLNEKSVAIIKKYQEKYDTTQADIIRRALNYFDSMDQATEKIPLDTIVAYIDFLADKEHLILDIAQLKSIFTEIGEGSKKFWDEVYKVGDFHRKEYSEKEITEPQDILKYIEKTNLYSLKMDSKNNFTLVLSISESSKFLKTFFEGVFNNYPRPVEIREEYKKIRMNFS